MELGGRAVGRHALGLVDRQPEARFELAQPRRDLAVGARDAAAPVDDENDRVGLGDRLLRLARHLEEDALGGAGLQPAGVDGDERAPARAALAVVPVPRHARHVVHDGVAAARQPVKEGRLADIGAADQRDDGPHSASANSPPFCVCTSSPEGSATGALRIAPPPVAKRATKAPESRARKCT